MILIGHFSATTGGALLPGGTRGRRSVLAAGAPGPHPHSGASRAGPAGAAGREAGGCGHRAPSRSPLPPHLRLARPAAAILRRDGGPAARRRGPPRPGHCAGAAAGTPSRACALSSAPRRAGGALARSATRAFVDGAAHARCDGTVCPGAMLSVARRHRPAMGRAGPGPASRPRPPAAGGSCQAGRGRRAPPAERL